MKKYIVNATDSDVYCISVVDFPAVESNFVALKKDEKPQMVCLSKEDKHMLYGVILRADFPIYRVDEYGEYYIEFGQDTIERLERKYMKNFAQKEWTIDHMKWADGLTLTESWLVTDPENDKSKALGLQGVSKGSWVGGCLVENLELWQEIREGRFNGFSVEAWCNLEEIQEEIKNKEQNNDQMKENKLKEIFEAIKSLVSPTEEVKEEEVQLEEQKPEEEEVKPEEETVTEETVQEEVKEEEVELEEETVKPEEVQEETVEEVDMQSQIDDLNTQLSALRKENDELKKANEKLSKTPSTKVVQSNQEKPIGGVKGAFAALKAQGFIE